MFKMLMKIDIQFFFIFFYFYRSILFFLKKNIGLWLSSISFLLVYSGHMT